MSADVRGFEEQLERGYQAADRGEWEAALNLFAAVLEAESSNVEALYGRAYVLRRTGRIEDAATALREALELHPGDSDLLSERGNLAYGLRQFADAERYHREALKSEPQHRSARTNLAEVLAATGRTEESQSLLEELSREGASDPFVALRLGWAALQNGDTATASRAFGVAEQDEKNKYSALLGISALRLVEHRYQESEEAARSAILLLPSRPTAHCNLAWVLTQQHARLEEAARSCETALKGDPSYSPAFDCLGVIAFIEGKLSRAEWNLRKAIEFDSTDSQARVHLARLLLQLDDPAGARSHLERVIEQDVAPGAAYQVRGELFFKLKEYQAALRDFRRAAVLSAESAKPICWGALTLAKLGTLFEAVALLQSGLQSARIKSVDHWQLHLSLGQVLLHLGEAMRDKEIFRDAMEEVELVVKEREGSKEIFFLAGVAAARAEEFAKSEEYLKRATQKDGKDLRVQRCLRQVQALTQRKSRLEVITKPWRNALLALMLAQLLASWLFFSFGRLGEASLAVLVPLLWGLTLGVFFLPRLAQFKVAGFEATLEKVAEVNTAEILQSFSPDDVLPDLLRVAMGQGQLEPW